MGCQVCQNSRTVLRAFMHACLYHATILSSKVQYFSFFREFGYETSVTNAPAQRITVSRTQKQCQIKTKTKISEAIQRNTLLRLNV